MDPPDHVERLLQGRKEERGDDERAEEADHAEALDRDVVGQVDDRLGHPLRAGRIRDQHVGDLAEELVAPLLAHKVDAGQQEPGDRDHREHRLEGEARREARAAVLDEPTTDGIGRDQPESTGAEDLGLRRRREERGAERRQPDSQRRGLQDRLPLAFVSAHGLGDDSDRGARPGRDRGAAPMQSPLRRARAAVVGPRGSADTPLYRALPQIMAEPRGRTTASEGARDPCHRLLADPHAGQARTTSR